jgi:hypothetical protein
MDTLPDRQVARIALMLIKHGDRGSHNCDQSKEWVYHGWWMYATPRRIEIVHVNRWNDDTFSAGTILPRSQLGLAIRKS